MSPGERDEFLVALPRRLQEADSDFVDTPSDKPQPALGKAIRRLREKKGLTQEAVAHDAGITTATVGVIERGPIEPDLGHA